MYTYVAWLRGFLWMWHFGYVEPRYSQFVGTDQIDDDDTVKNITATPATLCTQSMPRWNLLHRPVLSHPFPVPSLMHRLPPARRSDDRETSFDRKIKMLPATPAALATLCP